MCFNMFVSLGNGLTFTTALFIIVRNYKWLTCPPGKEKINILGTSTQWNTAITKEQPSLSKKLSLHNIKEYFLKSSLQSSIYILISFMKDPILEDTNQDFKKDYIRLVQT